MNSTAERFLPLRHRAAQIEERAGQALAAALGRHAQAERAHAELSRYEAEYSARSLPATAAVTALRQQAAFVARLREALRCQADRTQAAALELEQVRERWLAAHREIEKLDRLGAQLSRQARSEESRRQGREMDEAALRRHGLAGIRAVGSGL